MDTTPGLSAAEVARSLERAHGGRWMRPRAVARRPPARSTTAAESSLQARPARGNSSSRLACGAGGTGWPRTSHMSSTDIKHDMARQGRVHRDDILAGTGPRPRHPPSCNGRGFRTSRGWRCAAGPTTSTGTTGCQRNRQIQSGVTIQTVKAIQLIQISRSRWLRFHARPHLND